MWLKEDNFNIRLGGQTFINVPVLLEVNGESLFTVRRHEDTGEVSIDCDVYGEDGEKIASIKRNNAYPGDKASYTVDRSEDHMTLTESSSGIVLAQIKKRGGAQGSELDVSVSTYLPDGQLLKAGPDSSSIGGVFMQGNMMADSPVGISIKLPNLVGKKSFDGVDVHLDGKLFRGCNFKSCKLIFSAKAPFSITGCNFGEGNQWKFEGAASLTVDVMTKLHQGGFQPVIDHLIGLITNKK